MQAKEEHKVASENCEHPSIRIVHEYTKNENREEAFPCKCGKSRNGLAVETTYAVAVCCGSQGKLDENRKWVEGETNYYDEGEKEGISREVFCSECAKSAPELGLEYHVEESAIVQDGNNKFMVQCSECGLNAELDWPQLESTDHK